MGSGAGAAGEDRRGAGRGLPTPIVVLGAALLAQSVLTMVACAVAVGLADIRSSLGLTLFEAGLLPAAVTLGAVVTALPWGMASDRVGARVPTIAGLAVSSLALAAATFSSDLAFLVATLFLAGASGAVGGVAARSAAGWFSAARRGRALSVASVATMLAAALVALSVPLLFERGGLDAVFATLAVATGLAALAALLLRPPPGDRRADGLVSPLRAVRQPMIGRVLVAGAALSVAHASLYAFLALYLEEEYGWGDTAAAGVLAAVLVSAAAARLGVAAASDALRRRIAPLVALGATAALLLGLAAVAEVVLASSVGPLLVAAAVVALCEVGLTFTIVAEASSPETRGTALAAYAISRSVGMALAPPLFGLIVGLGGWAVGFGVLAAAAIGSVVLTLPLALSERAVTDA